ncbi:hypothetical protein Dimus_019500 [Dionaea muscipula]
MPLTLFLKPFLSAPSINFSKRNSYGNSCEHNLKIPTGLKVFCLRMPTPTKFMRKKKKVEIFKDSADEADQKNWRRLMLEIEESGSAVPVLRSRRDKHQALPKDTILGTLVRLKQLKKWNLVGEILEWLRTQHWWDFNEMDFAMLMTAYGKQGDFRKAERVMGYMNKKAFAPSVVPYTALMEAYGRGGRYEEAAALFHRMQTSGPEPSAVTYQIILKIFVEGNKFKEAEEIFESLLNDEKSSIKPDQKLFHMMIYMHRKAGSYEKACKILSLMAERGVQQSAVTYNSLMSFETSYKEVSHIYDKMQRAGIKPDVVSYALLINAYGKARREDEALAVFVEMLDAGVRPTRKTYNILLDAFAISGMVEQARIVFKSMRRDRFTPDLYSYTTMLSAYINASDMDGAEKFFRRLRQDKIEANVVTYGTLIYGYAKGNDLEKMMKTYEEMILCGIKANQTIFTTIMDAYGKNGDFDSAVFWYKEMESRGFPPDKKAKNILLSVASSDEEREEATQIVEKKGDRSTGDHAFSEYPSDSVDDAFSEYASDSKDDYVDDEFDEDISSLKENEDDLILVEGW